MGQKKNLKQKHTTQQSPQKKVATNEPPKRTGPTGVRLWVFRGITVFIFPLLLVLLVEGGLRLADVGVSMDFAQTATIDGKEKVIFNPKFTWRFFSPTMARYVPPFAIEKKKPEKTFRIFLLGGSAAMGDPQPAFGMGAILEEMLSSRYTDVNFQVVNVASTAINSHVVLPIARACADLEPDMFVIYLGNNEVVGPYGAGTVFAPLSSSLSAIRMGIALRASRTGQLLKRLVNSYGSEEERGEVWGGMRMFMEHQVQADSDQLKIVRSHFEQNLRDICAVAQGVKVPILLSSVAVDLRDTAPFASVNNLEGKEFATWQDAYKQALEKWRTGEAQETIDLLKRLLEQEPAYAEAHFVLARCFEKVQQIEQAVEQYHQALDLDSLRFRADKEVNAIIRKVAESGVERGVFLVESEKAIDDLAPNGLPGHALFYDHVHPTFVGHYTIARVMLDRVEQALPEDVRAHRNESGLLSQEECAARLAFTDYDQRAVLQLMARRLSVPPFTNQVGREQRDERLQGEIANLERVLFENGGFSHALDQYGTRVEHLLASHSKIRTPLAEFLLENLAGSLFREGKVDEARNASFVLLGSAENRAIALAEAGTRLAAQRKYEEARVYLAESLKINDAPLDTHLKMAICLQGLYSQGKADAEDVAAHYANVLKREPSHQATQQAYAKLRLDQGLVLLKQGEKAAAEGKFEEAVKIYQDQERAWFSLGGLAMDRQDRAKARKCFTEVLRINPNNKSAQQLLVRVALVDGR